MATHSSILALRIPWMDRSASSPRPAPCPRAARRPARLPHSLWRARSPPLSPRASRTPQVCQSHSGSHARPSPRPPRAARPKCVPRAWPESGWSPRFSEGSAATEPGPGLTCSSALQVTLPTPSTTDQPTGRPLFSIALTGLEREIARSESLPTVHLAPGEGNRLKSIKRTSPAPRLLEVFSLPCIKAELGWRGLCVHWV